MRRRQATISLFWFCAAAAVAATPFEEGNIAFKEGRFENAARSFKQHISENGDGPAVRFNLGRTRERLGDPGGAVVEWERALRLSPGYQPAAEALAKTRETTGARTINEGWWSVLKPPFFGGLEGWIAALGGWILAFGILGFWITRLRKTAAQLCTGGLVFLSLGLLWWRDATRDLDAAIIVERSVTARSVAASAAKTVSELPAGSQIRLLDQSAGWWRCALPEGLTGWIEEGAFERIHPAPMPRKL